MPPTSSVPPRSLRPGARPLDAVRARPVLVAVLLVVGLFGWHLMAGGEPAEAASASSAASTTSAVPAHSTAPVVAAPVQGGLTCGSLPVISSACSTLVESTSWALDCGLGGVADCAGDVTESVVAGAFDYFARWVAVGAIGAIDMVWDGITGTTTPVLDSSTSVFQTSMAAARSLAVPLLVLAGLYSLLKADASIAVKSAFLYLPGSIIGMVVAAYVITALLAATDQFSEVYVGDGQTGIAQWLDDLGGSIAAGVGITAPILLVVFSFVLIAASILVWLVMIVRSAAILITFAFMPLAFAALIFPATRGWIRRLVEIQISFILAKPVILAVMSLGSSTLNDADNAIVGMMQASALFFLAAFSPFTLMKLLPFVDEGALAAIESPSRAPSRTASTALGYIGGRQIADRLSGSQQTPPIGTAAAGNGNGGGQQAAGGPAGGGLDTPLGGASPPLGGGDGNNDRNGESGQL